MNAMILAAGRGNRLRPLTDNTPKPLIAVGDRSVIERSLAQLARLGVERVVINVWHLAQQLIGYVGDGSGFGVEVVWSPEERPLNTGGGVRHALPLLGGSPFLVVNGDILWDLDLAPLLTGFDPQVMDALLALVPNPAYGGGDFLCSGEDGRLVRGVGRDGSWTYTGIQILKPRVVSAYPDAPFSLNQLYDDAIERHRLFGVPLTGRWADMGTLDRLAQARKGW